MRAEQILNSKLELLLIKYIENIQVVNQPKFIGMFQGIPDGDILYEDKGVMNLSKLRYAIHKTHKQSIFISIAPTESEFLKIMEEDDFADNGWEM